MYALKLTEVITVKKLITRVNIMQKTEMQKTKMQKNADGNLDFLQLCIN
jgi:hypothetical protein